MCPRLCKRSQGYANLKLLGPHAATARRLLMPLSGVETTVIVMAPGRRRRLSLLSQRIYRHHPITRGVAAAFMGKASIAQRLGGNGPDLPGALQFINAVADDSLFGTGIPLQFRCVTILAAEEVRWLGRNCECVRRGTTLHAQFVYRPQNIGVNGDFVVGRLS